MSALANILVTTIGFTIIYDCHHLFIIIMPLSHPHSPVGPYGTASAEFTTFSVKQGAFGSLHKPCNTPTY